MKRTPAFDDVPLYIDGERRTSSAGEMMDNLYPATGERLCHVHVAAPEDIEAAVAAAKRSFAVWSKTHPVERGRILRRAAGIIQSRQRMLAELEVYDTGKPIREAESDDVVTAIDCLDYMGAQAASLHGHQFDFGESFAYTRREPLGVCVGIGAWNYPIQLACWKAAPALVCGNAMVFKPSEVTPLCTLKIAEIFIEAGLPAGLFNVVQGYGDVG